MEFHSQRLRDSRSSGSRNKDGKDEYSRSNKDDHLRGKDDRSRSKDEHSRGKEDHVRAKDHSRSKDDYSRGKLRRTEVERSSLRSSGQQKLPESARDGSEGRRTSSSGWFLILRSFMPFWLLAYVCDYLRLSLFLADFNKCECANNVSKHIILLTNQ